MVRMALCDTPKENQVTASYAPGTFDPRSYGDFAEYSRARDGQADVDTGHLVFSRVPGWHKLGTVMPEPLTMLEALEYSKNDYDIIVRPALERLNGEVTESDRFFQIVRGPRPGDEKEYSLDYATKRFRPLQNREIAETLQELSKTWPVESMGTIDNGEIFFFCLGVGQDEVAGEPIYSYYSGVDHKTPGGALTLAYSPMRWDCRNCMRIGLREATVKLNIRHTGEVLERFTAYADLMAQLKGARVKSLEMMNRLAITKVDRDAVEELIRGIYKEPKRPKELFDFVDVIDKPAFVAKAEAKYLLDLDLMRRYQVETVQLYDKLCDEYPRIGGTAWAALQAVVEREDHARNTVAAARAAMFGIGAQRKEKIWAAVMELAR